MLHQITCFNNVYWIPVQRIILVLETSIYFSGGSV